MARMDWDRVNREARLHRDTPVSEEQLDYRRLLAKPGARRRANQVDDHQRYGHVLGEPQRHGKRRWRSSCTCGWAVVGKKSKVSAAHRNHYASIELIIHGPKDESVPGHQSYELERRPGYAKGGWVVTCECGENFGPSKQHQAKRAWRRHEDAVRPGEEA